MMAAPHRIACHSLWPPRSHSAIATATPAKIATPPSRGVGRSDRPRSRGWSTAPMRRATRAVNGVTANVMAAATRPANSASIAVRCMTAVFQARTSVRPRGIDCDRAPSGRRILMRVWMDFSASAHPIVLRPVVERLRARGHEVEMTARDYAQTLDICQIQGLDAVQIGEHGGAGRLGKLRSLAARTRAMKRFGRGRGFDLAIGHGSNDLALAARSLRIPAVNTFDY